MGFDFRQGLGIFSRPFFTFIEAKWKEMRLALLQGNVERALNHFVSYSQERYRSIFLSFSSEKMQAVFGDFIDLRVGSISDYVAYCGSIRREDEELYSYPVTFILDRDGVWKIKSF